jgi:ABC-type transport system substrate-binding protein
MGRGGRATRTVAILFVGACLAAACSGGDDSPEPSTTTLEVPAEVVEGGTARLGLPGPAAIDPATANLASPSDQMVADLLYDGLTAVDADGVAQPALAASWHPDATGTIWDFELRPDATFASGRPVTPADVIATLERVAKQGEASLVAVRLESVLGFADLVAGTAEHLTGLSAPSTSAVRVQLAAPLGVLPVLLASPAFGVVDVASLDKAVASPAAVDDLDLSGSWAVAPSDQPADDAPDNGVLRLERRPDALGHLDAVELWAFDDSKAAYNAFERSDVDWALVPGDAFQDATSAFGDEQVTPFHAELFFGLNVASPALAKPELRQAIQAAIDRAAIVEEVYADRADPLGTVVPVGVAGHDDGRCPGCVHDTARAKALLAAAFPDGAIPTVHVDFDQSSSQEAMARLVVEQLQAVGIPAELRGQPLADYKQFVVTGGQEIFSLGWIGAYASPDAYLAPLFASASNDNLTAYASPAVDAALAAARAAPDAAAAGAQWATVESLALADAAVVPIAQLRIQAVAHVRLQGLSLSVDATADWSAVWVIDGR